MGQKIPVWNDGAALARLEPDAWHEQCPRCAVEFTFFNRAFLSSPCHPAAALFHRGPRTAVIQFSLAMVIRRLRQGPRGRPPPLPPLRCRHLRGLLALRPAARGGMHLYTYLNIWSAGIFVDAL